MIIRLRLAYNIKQNDETTCYGTINHYLVNGTYIALKISIVN